jgi:hypothetical protein
MAGSEPVRFPRKKGFAMQTAEEMELSQHPESPYSERFPREVEFVISAIEAGPRPLVDRQAIPRMRHRVKAFLRLFSDGPDAVTRVLYTRQASVAGLGFLTNRPLPLSHGGVISVPGPDGQIIEVACTVLRCRQAAPGWYEGAVYFNRAQSLFEAPLS